MRKPRPCETLRTTDPVSTTNEPPDSVADPCSASISRQTPGISRFRVQPVPNAAARIVPTGGRGIAKDRLQLLSMYGDRFRKAMAVVAGALSKSSRRDEGVDALADLAAVHLYLSTEWAWLDDILLEGTVGIHLPLARCVASGLGRLPSYRGPAITRTSAVGSVADWYCTNHVVIEQGFWTASASAAAPSEGGPRFLVWSLTGRRTRMVDPHTPGRLVFAPGTCFKVLQVTEGQHPLVLMRELFPMELGAHPADGDHTAWLDVSTAAELEQAAMKPAAPASTGIAGPQGRLPGLIPLRDQRN